MILWLLTGSRAHFTWTTITNPYTLAKSRGRLIVVIGWICIAYSHLFTFFSGIQKRCRTAVVCRLLIHLEVRLLAHASHFSADKHVVWLAACLTLRWLSNPILENCARAITFWQITDDTPIVTCLQLLCSLDVIIAVLAGKFVRIEEWLWPFLLVVQRGCFRWVFWSQIARLSRVRSA